MHEHASHIDHERLPCERQSNIKNKQIPTQTTKTTTEQAKICCELKTFKQQIHFMPPVLVQVRENREIQENSNKFSGAHFFFFIHYRYYSLTVF